MKKTFILVSLLFAMVILADVINMFRTSDSMTLDGYLFIKDGAYYLINDENFNAEVANELVGEELIWNFSQVYVIDKIPFSFSKFRSGQKVKVWHNGTISESNPAKVKVLKMKKMNL